MSNTTIIIIFNSGNSNITNFKTQHCQIMRTITNKTLKFKLMLKKPVVARNYIISIISILSY